MSQKIVEAMAELDEDILYEEVRKAGVSGVPALELVKSLQAGLTEVGNRFQRKEYFLSELMLSADMFNQASALIKIDEGSGALNSIGTFVIGTVKSDVHDIGKNIVAAVMRSNGFKVIDLGVDVPVERFIEAVKEHNPQIIGMSCLLTTCFNDMKATVDTLKKEGLTDGRLILIGGGPTDEHTVKFVGADACCASAQDTVIASKKFLGVK
jgi:methylmalonyl-CoA mutase cobalamin-binding domain/chain